MSNQKPSLIGERHPSLPKGLDAEALGEWLRSSAVETFTDSKKTLLTPEEISGYEHESVVAGREVNRLEDVLAQVRDHVKKGSETKLKITIPATLGVKELTEKRRENDDLVEAGHIMDTVEVFGIPNAQTEKMEYFTIDGELIADRTRDMSAKERHEHLGMFQNVRERNAKLSGADENGEVKTGTD